MGLRTFWVGGDIVLEEELCKKYYALNQAGIPMARILTRALAKYLDRPMEEIIKETGLLEETELPEWDFKPVPEKGKK